MSDTPIFTLGEEVILVSGWNDAANKTTIIKVTPTGKYRVAANKYLYDSRGHCNQDAHFQGGSRIAKIDDSYANKMLEKCNAKRLRQKLLKAIEQIDDIELLARVESVLNKKVGAESENLSSVSFQSRVYDWLLACFGKVIAADAIERNHRFLEESLELVQACGCTQKEAHQLVDYVFNRPVGEKSQEVGGVMVTLAALCEAQELNMQPLGETELARVWTKIEKIRAKQLAKPQFSPLPSVYPDRKSLD